MAGSGAARQASQGVAHISDVRRWVAHRGLGISRLLLVAQAAMEDIVGAVDAGQYEVAAIEARTTLLQCLSIRSLASSGELDGLYMCHLATFDPFAGLDANQIADGLALVQQGLDISDRATGLAWAARIQTYVDETERLLDLEEPLPELRSPKGLYSALGVARQWLALMDELGLPSLLPTGWTRSNTTSPRPER